MKGFDRGQSSGLLDEPLILQPSMLRNSADKVVEAADMRRFLLQMSYMWQEFWFREQN